ncbi:PTS mannitol transporter subunit IICB [Tessaracoccus antarcticus]|uniref:PTS mannitol transporter subunit IICB n=1 Tax=Tessaracoccus antarcticus TaxID=2479848 RepID=UPI0018F79ABA
MSLPDATLNKNLEGTGARARVQRFGGYLAGMIMPNIGAFIAWGLITALFIPTGWLPNESLASLVGPTITFLLPILIGYTGGRMVHGQRGAVIGALATMGAIAAADIPMFLGAMVMGPLAAYVLKKFDRAIDGKVPSGFEMLVDNFSLGIIGAVMAVLGKVGIGPVVGVLVDWLGSGVGWLVGHSLLPLASIFIEPAKVLFLNNAINHGVLSPLGAAESQELGKSVLFMLESNPGPGLGLLLAFVFFGPTKLRGATWGSVIIHFFGGIHEIYFPYILMKPRMILATIAGGMTGVATALVLGAGLVAPASPGSIIAYTLVAPRGGLLPVYGSVLAATVVSFFVAAVLFGFGRGKDVADEVTTETAHDEVMQESGSSATAPVMTATRSIAGKDVRTLIIACDAGMGSSVMVAGAMRKKLAPYGVTVTHSPVNEVPADATLIMSQSGLAQRVRSVAPHAVIVTFERFVGDPAFARIEAAIRLGETIE